MTPNPHESGESVKSSIDHLWSVYRLNQDFIRLADTKAAAVLAADSAIGASWAAIGSVKHNDPIQEPILFWIFLFAAPFLMASVFFCWRALIPRIDTVKFTSLTKKTAGDTTGGGASVIFFGEILSYQTSSKYRNAMRAACAIPEQLEGNLADQVTITARIAGIKFNSVRRAIQFLLPSLLLTIASVLVTNWCPFF